MYENMVKSINISTLPEMDHLIKSFRENLPKVYTEKELIPFFCVMNLLLKIGTKLGYTLMMSYLPQRPKSTGNLVVQFQNINKVLVTREQNKDWYYDLFALITALPSYLSLSWEEIETTVIAMNKELGRSV